MSHKTTIKTELTSKEYLTKALTKLGFNFKECNDCSLVTKGNYGVREKVDVLITDNNSSVGFRKSKDGTFEAVGDFYGMRTKDGKYLTEQLLKEQVTSASKELEIADSLQNMSFCEMTGSRSETDEYIEVNYERWVN